MTWLNNLDRFRTKPENQPAITEDFICKNCRNLFKGHYCPVCGQAVKDMDRPFGVLFINFLGDIFAFDTRYLRTMNAILFKPGYLSQEFFEGKRERFAPPMRMYIIASFFLFLLLQVYTNRIITYALDAPFTSQNPDHSRQASGALADSPGSDPVARLEASNYILPGFNLSMNEFIEKRDLRENLDDISTRLEARLVSEPNPRNRAKLREQVKLIKSPEEAVARIMKYMSWAFFLLLPLFAIILKLFYQRKKFYYIRHFIFSIHLHTFMFTVFSVLMCLLLVFPKVPPYISYPVLLTIPIYFILALKRFYNQGTAISILKMSGISIIYNIIFWFAVGWVFLRALTLV